MDRKAIELDKLYLEYKITKEETVRKKWLQDYHLYRECVTTCASEPFPFFIKGIII